MKNLKYILPALALFIIGCDSDDDGFYNTKYIDAVGLVTLETQPSYAVGDVLYVEAIIPQLLPEPGQDNLLDVRQSTGNAPTFDFSYILEKKIGADLWEVVDVTSDFILDQGDAETGAYVLAFLEFQEPFSSYVYRGGITLSQTGEYRLSYGFNTSAPGKVGLRSNSTGNNVTLNIFSTTNSLNTSGYYEFTVN